MTGRYETGLTVADAIQKIDTHQFLLPIVQKKFTWDRNQIHVLFDSIMRGYPINTFIFWEVKDKKIKEDIQFYQFPDEYSDASADNHPPFDTDAYNTYQAVIYERSDSPERALLRECLENGTLPGTHPEHNIPNEAIVRAFMQVLQRRPSGRYVTDRAVAKMLLDIPGREHDTNGYFYDGVDKRGQSVIKRGSRYILPPLQECRMWFDKNAKWDNRTDWQYEIVMRP